MGTHHDVGDPQTSNSKTRLCNQEVAYLSWASASPFAKWKQRKGSEEPGYINGGRGNTLWAQLSGNGERKGGARNKPWILLPGMDGAPPGAKLSMRPPSLCWKRAEKQDCASGHHLDTTVQGCHHISTLTKCSFPKSLEDPYIPRISLT